MKWRINSNLMKLGTAVAFLILFSPKADAAPFAGFWTNCKGLLGKVLKSVQAVPETMSHLVSPDGRFAVEIDEIDGKYLGQAYIYWVGENNSQLLRSNDSRIITVITDELSTGAARGSIRSSSSLLGYIDVSWSPDGQLLMLVDGYGNIEIHETRRFEEIMENNRNQTNVRGKELTKTKVRRHIGIGASNGLFVPHIKWLTNRTVEVKNGTQNVSMVATMTDDGVIGLSILKPVE